MAHLDDDTLGVDPTLSLERDPPTAAPGTLVSGTVGDRCVNCDARLLADQRYCVVCGERRGAARFSLPETTASSATAAGAPPSRAPRGMRLGAGALIGGVATLLLAILVGVIIGHDIAGSGNARTVASAPPRVIVTGAGSGAGTGTATSTTAARSASRGVTRAPKLKKQTTAQARRTAAAESSAATKVLGGKSAPPATVTVGQSGSGKGFNRKTHKFDGSFFGQ